MITKWKTSAFGVWIEPVECVKETEKQLVLRVKQWTRAGEPERFYERRVSKISSDRYFDSWDEAKAYLLERAQTQLVGAQRALQHRQDELGNIKGLKKPEAGG
jgi:hypothetical protein